MEGLALAVSHEQRAFQRLQQGVAVNIGAGIMDERAGLYVALGIDVQIAASAGDAAADILRIVLKIDTENGLALTEGPDTVINLHPLLRCGQDKSSGG